MAEFQFNPIDGFRDEVGFPNPTTGTAARAQVQSLLDQIRDALNAFDSVADGSSGANNTAMTPIASIGPQSDVQNVIEALVTRLQAVTAGSSGAKFIGAETIAGLIGNDVQALLSALKVLSDAYNTAQSSSLATHKNSSDHDARYYTQAISDAKYVLASAIQDIVLGQIPDGTLTDAKLSNAAGQIKDTFAAHLADYATFKGSKGLANGLAGLDLNGLVPQTQLPTTVFDLGRYCSDTNFDGTETFVGCMFNGNLVDLDHAVQPQVATSLPNASFGSTSAKSGLKIHTNKAMTGMTVNISINCTATRLCILDSSKTLLASTPILPGYFSASIFYPFLANTDYYVTVDNNGSSYASIYRTGQTYPVVGDYLNITACTIGATDNTADAHEISAILAFGRGTTGSVATNITPSDLKKWGNLKWAQTTVATGSSVTCNVYKSDGVTLLLSNVTSITDLSAIDTVVNPTIQIKWTLTRLLVADISPTLSSPSVTLEGSITTKVSGFLSDTTTVIPLSGTYVKTIPLGFAASRGRLVINGTRGHGIVFFNTDPTLSTSFSGTTGAKGSRLVDQLCSGSATDISLNQVCITGSNLILTFLNTNSSVGNTLGVSSLLWEVEK